MATDLANGDGDWMDVAQLAMTAVSGVSASRGGCFFAGTLVDDRRGPKNIETILEQDVVRAFNIITGEWEWRKVVETYVNDYVGEQVRFKINGEWIESTPHHPIWVVEGRDLEARPRPDHIRQAEQDATVAAAIPGRWVDAGDLRVGDVLYLMSGRRAPIEAIEVRQVAAKVYNFQVEGLHTYAVGHSRVLVHNNAVCHRTELEKLNLPKEGIYEFVAASGKKYIGQSKDIVERLLQHAAGKSPKFLIDSLKSLKVTEVLGGKTAREIREQLAIRANGGIDYLENIRNAIGDARNHLLEPFL